MVILDVNSGSIVERVLQRLARIVLTAVLSNEQTRQFWRLVAGREPVCNAQLVVFDLLRRARTGIGVPALHYGVGPSEGVDTDAAVPIALLVCLANGVQAAVGPVPSELEHLEHEPGQGELLEKLQRVFGQLAPD